LCGVNLTVVITSLTVESTNTVQVSGSGTVSYVTSALKSFVSGNKSKSLHGISLLSLTGRHVEERSIEETGLIYKATEGSHASVDTLASRVIVSLNIKSVGRDFPVAVDAIFKEFPELLGVGSAVGHSAGHADDGNLGLHGAARATIDRFSLLIDPWNELFSIDREVRDL